MEFQESIANINQTISSRKYIVIFGVIFAVCVLGGVALFIAGGLTAATTRRSGFSILIGVGMGVLFFGMIVFMVGCIIAQSRRVSRMRQAIANESAKYSSRSPTPCSWRLNTTRIYTGGYGNRRATVMHHVS